MAWQACFGCSEAQDPFEIWWAVYKRKISVQSAFASRFPSGDMQWILVDRSIIRWILTINCSGMHSKVRLLFAACPELDTIFELWFWNVCVADTGSCFPVLDYGSVLQDLRRMC